jgi:integrative and conjugative element protein (TIGR02256 family)
MQLLLPPKILKRLQRELRRAGKREIGGLLMGEHVREEVFRVVDISVQRSGGSQACFSRDDKAHKTQLQEFFSRTGEDYGRFNYLGEWHSHPSFEPLPSLTDIETMQSIVSDPSVGVNFVTLIIARLSYRARIELTATVFRVGVSPAAVPVSVEAEMQNPNEGAAGRWLRKIFKW